MPDTKNFSLRVSTIDGLLKKKDGISMKEMMDEVNERLDRRGVTHVKSKNTILRDLDEIRNRFYAKIITFRDEDDERIVKYRYADIDFSISWLLPILLEHRCQIELIFRFCVICLGPSFVIWAEELLDLLNIPKTVDDVYSIIMDNETRTLLANVFTRTMDDTASCTDDQEKRETISDLKKIFKNQSSFT